jgi:hypothetical protein
VKERVIPLWFRAFCWIAALTITTTLGVLIVRKLMPPQDVAPSYICFWAGGKLVASGQSPYDPVLQARIQQQYGWDKATDGMGFWDFLPYYYPPSLLTPVSALLVPLGYPTAKLTWFIINVELFFLTGYLLRHARTGVAAWVPVVVVPFFALSIYSMFVGQLVAMVFILIVAVWRLLQERWDRTAGWILAWITIKPQLTSLFLLAILLWSARQRRWRVLEGFALGSVTLLTVSALLVPSWPIQLVRALLEQPLPTADRPWVGATWLLLLRTLGLHGWMLWAAYIACAAPLLLILLRSALDRDSPLDDVIALSVLVPFFVAPYARAYDFPLLLIPLFLLLGKRLPQIWRALLPTIFIVLPFLHLWRLAASAANFNFMPQVWLFWIPLLLAGAWIATATKPRLGNLREEGT